MAAPSMKPHRFRKRFKNFLGAATLSVPLLFSAIKDARAGPVGPAGAPVQRQKAGEVQRAKSKNISEPVSMKKRIWFPMFRARGMRHVQPQKSGRHVVFFFPGSYSPANKEKQELNRKAVEALESQGYEVNVYNWGKSNIFWNHWNWRAQEKAAEEAAKNMFSKLARGERVSVFGFSAGTNVGRMALEKLYELEKLYDMLASTGMEGEVEKVVFAGSSMPSNTKFDKASKVCKTKIENHYSHGDLIFNFVGPAVLGHAGGVRTPHLSGGFDGFKQKQYVINKKIPNNKFPFVRSHEKGPLSPDFIKSVFKKVK
ncbi:MAG: hypothetical protein NTZ73_00875 [Candidatus Diapherotrites archaeon]|nr:hypothetical protein [Candidatus Diapherotrites archaeon]